MENLGASVENEFNGERLVGSIRVLAVLTELAKHPEGIGLEEMVRAIGSPKPTIHRALALLRRSGFAAQDGHGRYVLGDEFLRMAFAFHEARPDHIVVQPVLNQLSVRYLETVHYAVLDGTSVVYRAKVDPPTGAIKLTSTIGGRNPAHATAVGKLLLSYSLFDEAAVRSWVGDRVLERRTEKTKVTVEELHEEFGKIRVLGYSVDDQENEFGINCLALPVFGSSPSIPTGAVSISALTYRTPLKTLLDDLPAIRNIFGNLTMMIQLPTGLAG
jgi:IclR family acetate operon transcriptional repressor